MIITRGPHRFVVEDVPATSSWNFWSLFSNYSWEQETFEALDRIVQPGDLVFDIGAWVGPISLWLAKLGARVVAFEPDPEAYKALEKMIALNDMQEAITPVKLAIIDTERKIALHVNGNGGDSGSRVTQELQNDIEVQGVSLQKMIKHYGMPKVIKMDIEGGESLILPFAGPLLRKNNVSLVLSLHWYWYKPEYAQATNEEMEKWDVEELTEKTFLCRPK